MGSGFAPGDAVHTPLGKGTVREVRNNGRLLIEVQQRTVVMAEHDVSPVEPRGRRSSTARDATPSPATPPRGERQAAQDIDLHGLTVEEALVRIDEGLNEALLAGVAEMRFIHGRSGGRLRGALHQRLRAIPSVRGFRIDPRNAGVTIVIL